MPEGRPLARRIAAAAAIGLLAALFPSDCRLCRALLNRFSRLPVCQACLNSLAPFSVACCNQCGLPLESDAPNEVRCRDCLALEPCFARAASFGAYRATLRGLVHLLKYERVRVAADPLGELTAQAALHLEGDIDVEELLLVPVPVHPSRRRTRGFNQAELIARAALRHGLALALRRRLHLETAALQRVRFAESQVALSLQERLEQIRGAFQVARPERVRDREVLLLDDVMTTGATANECARVLQQAGARRVWVLTPARALRRAESADEFSVSNRPPSRRDEDAVSSSPTVDRLKPDERALPRLAPEDHSHGQS